LRTLGGVKDVEETVAMPFDLVMPNLQEPGDAVGSNIGHHQ
jgi:hypothetical protein